VTFDKNTLNGVFCVISLERVCFVGGFSAFFYPFLVYGVLWYIQAEASQERIKKELKI